MIDDFERKSVMRAREVLLHKLLRQLNLFYVFCLTLTCVHIHSVEPTIFFIIVAQLSIQILFTFSFRHTQFYHQCRYHSLCYLDIIGSVNMQSMYVCLVLNVSQWKLGSLKKLQEFFRSCTVLKIMRLSLLKGPVIFRITTSLYGWISHISAFDDQISCKVAV
jgi:hypothetical protein